MRLAHFIGTNTDSSSVAVDISPLAGHIADITQLDSIKVS